MIFDALADYHITCDVFLDYTLLNRLFFLPSLHNQLAFEVVKHIVHILEL